MQIIIIFHNMYLANMCFDYDAMLIVQSTYQEPPEDKDVDPNDTKEDFLHLWPPTLDCPN